MLEDLTAAGILQGSVDEMMAANLGATFQVEDFAQCSMHTHNCEKLALGRTELLPD